MKASIILAGLAAIVAGCGSAPVDTKPSVAAPQHDVTDIDPAQGEPDYWLKKQPVVSASGQDFEKLWGSAERVSESLLFEIDRRDRRSGLMTTQPNISAQWFEPWRRELTTSDDLANSSVAAYRRIIYWQFEQQGSGYTVTPRVLIQRQTVAERPISAVLNRGYFRRDNNTKDSFYGTPETDQGIFLPQNNWYPVGRDYGLESKLVELMRERLQ